MEGDKIKVLIGCINFNSYTGSELYVYELARELVNNGIDVTICSNIGGDLMKRALEFGVKLMDINRIDLNTKFDILHLNHYPVTKRLIESYPNTPVICGIHSEVISLEYPYKHDNIKKYIAIRPEIKDFLINEFSIDSNKISVIYNPVDSSRFKIYDPIKNIKKIVLFVGSIHMLRKNMLIDLIDKTDKEGSELWLVGREHEVKVSQLTNKTHVKLFPPIWNVEYYIRKCDETAGILLGRTTIESWLCDKPAWIYDVNNNGKIKSKELYQPPSDLNKFKSDFVVTQIMEEYKEVLR